MDPLLQEAISVFVETLESVWSRVHQLGRSVPGRDPSEYLADWAQASWEMLVEAAVASSEAELVYLQPYGDGADCNDVGSRVWQPGVSSTHAICVVPARGSQLYDELTGTKFSPPQGGLPLDQFVTLTGDGWYQPRPPFDHALVYFREQERVIPIDGLAYILAEVSGLT